MPEEFPFDVTELEELNAQIASCYAPEIHHLVQSSLPLSANGRGDLLVAVDYDGDWNTGNNWENLAQFDGLNDLGEPDGISTEEIDELDPKVYYSVVWTDIAWVITYGFYHPRDYSLADGDCCTGISPILPGDSHENDFEVVLVVVSRIDDNGIDKFQVVGGYSTPHGALEKYTYITSIPEVYIDDRTHAPFLNLDDNEHIDCDGYLSCDSRIPVGNPHVVYTNNTDPNVSPFVEIDEYSYPHGGQEYLQGFGEYELDDIFGDNPESLQSQRSNPLTFMNGGNTFNTETGGGTDICAIYGGGASAPWGQGAFDYETSSIQDIVCESMYGSGTLNCLNSPPLILDNPYHIPSCVLNDQATLIVDEDLEIVGYNSSQSFERIVVESGATLTITNSTLYFSSVGYVEVQKGGRLIIDDSHLTRCGSIKWQGIKAYTDNRSGPEGEVIIRKGSRIEDATVGLAIGKNSFFGFPLTKVTITGGETEEEQPIFINNDIGIAFNPGTTISSISNCNFFNREYDVNLVASSGLSIENSFFNQPIGSGWEFHAINSFNSTFQLTGGNKFYRTGIGVHVHGSLPFSSGAQIGSFNSAPNTFELGTAGIFSLNLTGSGFTTFPANSTIENNVFWGNTYAAYGAGYNFIDVTENTFTSSGGVTFDATGNYNNTINCNTFNNSDNLRFRHENSNSEFLSNDFNGGSSNIELTAATVRSIVGSFDNPAGNCFSGPNTNILVDNGSTSFNYFYKNIACQNPSGSGFNKVETSEDPENDCSNGRSPFANIDPDGDGELGLSEASYNAENICKPCILDSIALWVNMVTNLGGDNLYTVADESSLYPTETQLHAVEVLLLTIFIKTLLVKTQVGVGLIKFQLKNFQIIIAQMDAVLLRISIRMEMVN